MVASTRETSINWCVPAELERPKLTRPQGLRSDYPKFSAGTQTSRSTTYRRRDVTYSVRGSREEGPRRSRSDSGTEARFGGARSYSGCQRAMAISQEARGGGKVLWPTAVPYVASSSVVRAGLAFGHQGTEEVAAADVSNSGARSNLQGTLGCLCPSWRTGGVRSAPGPRQEVVSYAAGGGSTGHRRTGSPWTDGLNAPRRGAGAPAGSVGSI